MRDTVKRILVIEPSVIIAEGIRSIINNLAEYSVCGIVQEMNRTAAGRLGEYDADLLVVDPASFDSQTRAGGREMLKEATGAPAIALLTSAMNAEGLAGYDGVISLTDKSDEIGQKLSAALRTDTPDRKGEGEELSAREKEILICVAKGMLNKEIADHFCISIYTVITHRKNITRKTGIKTVAGLTVYALLNNLIDMNSME